MESLQFSFHNQVEEFVPPIKESRHGKHREGYIRPDRLNYNKKLKRREQVKKAVAKFRAKTKKPILSFNDLSDRKKKHIENFWKKVSRK